MLLRLIAILVLLLSLSLWGLFYLHSEKAVLEDTNKILVEGAKRASEREQETRKVLIARQAQIALQARKLVEAQQGASEALQRNKSWSDANVPTDVQNALSGPSDGPASVLQHN